MRLAGLALIHVAAVAPLLEAEAVVVTLHLQLHALVLLLPLPEAVVVEVLLLLPLLQRVSRAMPRMRSPCLHRAGP